MQSLSLFDVSGDTPKVSVEIYTEDKPLESFFLRLSEKMSEYLYTHSYLIDHLVERFGIKIDEQINIQLKTDKTMLNSKAD